MPDMSSRPSILRRAFRLLLALCLVAALAGATYLAGYYTQRFGLNPAHSVLTRVERKLKALAGQPSPLAQKMAQIESTHLRLVGQVYPQPGNDWVNGGSLTLWGDRLLVMNHKGESFVLREDEGALRRTPIVPPENGLEAYKSLARTGKYQGYQHLFQRVRFNHMLYVDEGGIRGLVLSYTRFDADRECYGTRVSWLPIPEAVRDVADLKNAASDWKTLFDTYPCQPLNPAGTALSGLGAGGRMAFRAPSTLYLSSGDYELDGILTYDAGIQSDQTSFGKIMAIDLVTGQSRIVSKGHRNPGGIAIDKLGRLWTVEHGYRGGDELNLIREGGNYGWPEETLGTLYSGLPMPIKGDYARHDLHDKPVYAWLPSVAPSSLVALDGFDPAWDGDLIAGSLSSAEFGQSLFHIRIEGERVLFVERIALGQRVRFVTQVGPDRIAVLTDRNDLILFRAERRPDPLEDVRKRVAAEFPPALAQRVLSTLDACNQCHSFEQYVNGTGPSLNGVAGRKIATTTFSGHSPSLRARGGVWDDETLKVYLRDPNAFAPGTGMPDPEIDDPDLLDALIWALKQVDTDDPKHMTYN